MPVSGFINCDVCGKRCSKKNQARHKASKSCRKPGDDSDVERALNTLSKNMEKKAELVQRAKVRSRKAKNFFATWQKPMKYRMAKYIRHEVPEWMAQTIVANKAGVDQRGRHSHAVIVTKEPMEYEELQVEFKKVFKCRIDDLETCKKVKDSVRYVSKEDHDCLLLNIDKDWLHLSTLAKTYARNVYYKSYLNPTSYPYCRLSTQQQRQFKEYYHVYCKEHENALEAAEMAESELLPWQKVAICMLEHQTNRKLLWVWDENGNTGKTFLCKYLTRLRNGVMFENGRSTDIAFAYELQDVVCFNYQRAEVETVNYKILENFKDGILFSPKYESCVKTFTPPALLCVANFEPDFEKLSRDRWEVLKIKEDRTIDENYVI